MSLNRILAAAALLAAATASSAASTFWVGTDGTTTHGFTTGTDFGSLATPSNLTFTDLFDANTTSVPISLTDDWTFSVPAGTTIGSTVTGAQLALSNFSISGDVTSFTLFAGTPGSGTSVATGTSLNSFADALHTVVLNAGSYFLEVKATLGAGTAKAPTYGGYTGTFLATALVPEPRTWAMLAAGLTIVGFTIRRRRA